LFSFALLALGGWGAKENGMVLYTLYFSWAFLALSVLCVSGLLKRFGRARWIVFGILLLAMAALNVHGLAHIISFGHQFYPTS
jgi:hypothetical protein